MINHKGQCLRNLGLLAAMVKVSQRCHRAQDCANESKRRQPRGGTWDAIPGAMPFDAVKALDSRAVFLTPVGWLAHKASLIIFHALSSEAPAWDFTLIQTYGAKSSPESWLGVQGPLRVHAGAYCLRRTRSALWGLSVTRVVPAQVVRPEIVVISSTVAMLSGLGTGFVGRGHSRAALASVFRSPVLIEAFVTQLTARQFCACDAGAFPCGLVHSHFVRLFNAFALISAHCTG